MSDTIERFICESSFIDYSRVRIDNGAFIVDILSRSTINPSNAVAGVLSCSISCAKFGRSERIRKLLSILIHHSKLFLLGDIVYTPHDKNTYSTVVPIIMAYDGINFDDVYHMSTRQLEEEVKGEYTIGSYLITIKTHTVLGVETISSVKTVSEDSIITIHGFDLHSLFKMLKAHDKKIYTQIKKRRYAEREFRPMQPYPIKRTERALEDAFNKMLATSNGEYILAEEKIDGCRCLAHVTVKENNHYSVVLRTKNGHEIVSQPKLAAEIEDMVRFFRVDMVLDGELTSAEGLTQSEVTGIVNSKEPRDERLTYTLFDMAFPYDKTVICIERKNAITKMVAEYKGRGHGKYIRENPYYNMHTIDELSKYLQKLAARDAEGVILRSPNGLYRYSDSSNILRKYKFMHENEFLCIGVTADIDGNIEYIFKTATESGQEATFTAAVASTDENRRKLYQDYKDGTYDPINSQFTIRYARINERGIPMHMKVLTEKI